MYQGMVSDGASAAVGREQADGRFCDKESVPTQSYRAEQRQAD